MLLLGVAGAVGELTATNSVQRTSDGVFAFLLVGRLLLFKSCCGMAMSGFYLCSKEWAQSGLNVMSVWLHTGGEKHHAATRRQSQIRFLLLSASLSARQPAK